jgi:uncharacterized protein YutE (UPF0331/DUF86 family)
MYYVNRELIRRKLACVPELAESAARLSDAWRGDPLQGLAQERCLHLAAELVTDVGGALIDGFLMRDAASYEDIVGIIAEEGVVSAGEAERLTRLVSLRKALVQEYERWPRKELHPLTRELPQLLPSFAGQVESYLKKELEPFQG